jgi:PGF-CTERM protein
MVMSVFAGAAAFAGTAAANHDNADAVDVDSGSVVFQGQQAWIDISGESYSELTLEDSDGVYQNSYEADDAGHIAFSTNNFDGEYDLVNPSGTSAANFQVVEQTFDVSSSLDGDTLKVNLQDTNRPSEFDVEATSESSGFTNYTGEGDDNALLTYDRDQDETAEIDVSGLEAGNHTITLDVTDTTTTETLDITIPEEGDESYSLAEGFPTDERGDVAEFTVELENTDSAYVQFGSADVNYAVAGTVVDDGDGQVTVQIHTYESDNTDAGEVMTVAGDDEIDGTPEYVDDTGALDSGSVIAAGDYEITVYDSDPADEGEEQTFGTLILNERSTDAAQTWVTSEDSFEDASDVYSAVAEGDSVAKDESSSDTMIVQVEASGLYDYLESEGDFGSNGLSATIEQTNPDPNTGATTLAVDSVVTDAENNTFFMVVDLSNAEAGDNYEATFTVGEGNKLVASSDAAESVSTEFSVTERTVSFDTNDGDTYVVSQGETEVTGTSTLAPGTEFQVTARSSAANLLKNQMVTVQDDGTWNATFDFSDVDDETEFSFTNKATSDEASAMVMAGFGDDPTTTTTTTTTTETTTTTTTTTTTEDMTTETDTTTTTEEPSDNGGGIPGFGVSVALVAIIAAALLALRRSN